MDLTVFLQALVCINWESCTELLAIDFGRPYGVHTIGRYSHRSRYQYHQMVYYCVQPLWSFRLNFPTLLTKITTKHTSWTDKNEPCFVFVNSSLCK